MKLFKSTMYLVSMNKYIFSHIQVKLHSTFRIFNVWLQSLNWDSNYMLSNTSGNMEDFGLNSMLEVGNLDAFGEIQYQELTCVLLNIVILHKQVLNHCFG
jgi:hypothetical protein